MSHLSVQLQFTIIFIDCHARTSVRMLAGIVNERIEITQLFTCNITVVLLGNYAVTTVNEL